MLELQINSNQTKLLEHERKHLFRRAQKNRPVLLGRFLCEIRRKCFLVSTAEYLNSSQNQINERHEKRNTEYLSSLTVTCANSLKSTIKKAPYLREVECLFATERLCEELF